MKRVLTLLCGSALMVGSTSAVSFAASRAAGAEDKEITIPAGTVLPVDLQTAVGSDTSRVEQPVRGTLRRPVYIRGIEVLPAGALVTGHVTRAERPGKVKGRGFIAMRFTEID